mmetsp:Transcript_99934/g.322220  ORF Transcript_99934/g.322220 Transcript_99934/m.322220 type:complete len:214 (-) Transcript_99934:61-702(-)
MQVALCNHGAEAFRSSPRWPSDDHLDWPEVAPLAELFGNFAQVLHQAMLTPPWEAACLHQCRWLHDEVQRHDILELGVHFLGAHHRDLPLVRDLVNDALDNVSLCEPALVNGNEVCPGLVISCHHLDEASHIPHVNARDVVVPRGDDPVCGLREPGCLEELVEHGLAVAVEDASRDDVRPQLLLRAEGQRKRLQVLPRLARRRRDPPVQVSVA